MHSNNPTLFLIAFILFSITCFAQNGINYKAIVKDNSGNIVANQQIDVQFKILQGTAQTNVYEESHMPTTDPNGILIVNIGEGTVVTGDFTTIDWSSDSSFLNVKVDIGAGFVDLSTTQFKVVPYALNAGNVSGLEAIDEGNGIGWRLKGADPNTYGNIGLHSFDFSIGVLNSTEYGATGDNAIAFGKFVKASGNSSTVFGSLTTASGLLSTAMGDDTTASGDRSIAIGVGTTASGNNATAMGFRTLASSAYSVAMGRYSVGGGSPNSWNSTDPLFEIGNGSSPSLRNNALTVLKNGQHTINSSSYGLVLNAGNQGNGDGIVINSLGRDGIVINSPGRDGIGVYNAGTHGVYVSSADFYGGVFIGNQAGIHAESNNNANSDITLGSTSGIISSDPNITGSDLLLNANGNVEITVNKANTLGQTGFSIKNDETAETVFSVSEFGQVTTQGRLLIETSNDASLSPGSGSFLIGDYNDKNIIMDDNEIMARDNYQTSPLYLQRDGGNLSIGNVGVPNVALDVQGSIQYTGSITDVSDRRLKENFKTIANPLEKLRSITGYSYNMIDDWDKIREYGVIAQDVQKIFPEIVTIVDEENEYLGVSYTQLIPVLIEAVKAQHKLLENQNLKISKLSVELQDSKNLEQRIKQIESLLKTPKQ